MQPTGQIQARTFFVTKTLLEQGHAHPLTHHQCGATAEVSSVTETMGPVKLKIVPLWLVAENMGDPALECKLYVGRGLCFIPCCPQNPVLRLRRPGAWSVCAECRNHSLPVDDSKLCAAPWWRGPPGLTTTLPFIHATLAGHFTGEKTELEEVRAKGLSLPAH